MLVWRCRVVRRERQLRRCELQSGQRLPATSGASAVAGDHVDLIIGEQLIRRHKVKHDRTRERGALANPGGRPRRINAA